MQTMWPNPAVVRTGGRRRAALNFCAARRTLPRWAFWIARPSVWTTSDRERSKHEDRRNDRGIYHCDERGDSPARANLPSQAGARDCALRPGRRLGRDHANGGVKPLGVVGPNRGRGEPGRGGGYRRIGYGREVAAGRHTLLANSSAHVVSAALLTNLSYDPLKDFVPVAPLTSQAYVLVVGKGSGFATMRDLIAAAKAKPGELTFTSAGIGSGTHLLAEKFNLDAGVRMIHVPTAGAGAANKEIIEGRITYWFSSLTPALPHLREGRLLALAVSGGKRMAGVPDVPTVAEAGISGFDSGLWYGIWAPAGIPNAIVDKIARDVSRALAMPESREHIAKSGAEAMSMTPAEFAHFVRGEAESAARIVKAAGIKPQ